MDCDMSGRGRLKAMASWGRRLSSRFEPDGKTFDRASFEGRHGAEGSRFPVQGQGPQRRRRFQLLWLDNQPPRPQEERPSRVSRPLPTLFWRTGLHHRDGPVVVNIIEELLE